MAVLPPDPVFTFQGDMDHIHCMEFAQKPNDNETRRLLAATEAGYVYIWDLETNRLHHKQVMGSSIQSVHAVDNDVIVYEKSGKVTKWVVEGSTYVPSDSYDCESGFCKTILLKDCLLVAQGNGALDVVDVENMQMIRQLKPGVKNPAKLGSLMAIEYANARGRECIMGGYETGIVILWDYVTGEKLDQAEFRPQITSLTFDAISRRGAVTNSSNVFQVFEINADFDLVLKCEVNTSNDGCNRVNVRSDGKILVHCGWDGKVRIFSWKSLRLLVVLTEHHTSCTDVAFSPGVVKYWDSKVFATCAEDGRIALWNIYN